MVACPKCVTNNTLDSAFCKKCGAILPVSVIEEEQEKLREIVAKGMESYQTGNLEESMMIAEHSILTNPSYGEAYALKGLIHERKGEYAEALDCYETVVALNPDSTIDKIKLNQLRNAFAQRQAGEPKPDRKNAALIAVAATFLVAAMGAVTYGIMQSSHETKQNPVVSNPLQTNPSALDSGKTNPGPQNVNDGNRPNQGTNPGDVPPLGGNPDNNPPSDVNRLANRSSNRDRYRPGLEDDGGSYVPISVGDFGGGAIGGGGNSLPKPGGDNGGNGGSKPTTPKPDNPTKPGPVDGGDPPVQPNKENQGTIDISVSTKGSGNATSRGGDGGSSNGKKYQRDAQGLGRQGKNAQAREAYQKAIDAYQEEISSGKGDADAAQAGINSCRQALKNLKD